MLPYSEFQHLSDDSLHKLNLRRGRKVTIVIKVHWKTSRVHYLQIAYNQRMDVIKVPNFSINSLAEQNCSSHNISG